MAESGEVLPPLSDETENAVMTALGVSVTEVSQRLATDEVLHEIDARQVHRLLVGQNKQCLEALLHFERQGGSSSRAAILEFREAIVQIFHELCPNRMREYRSTTEEVKREKPVSKMCISEDAVPPVIEQVCTKLEQRYSECGLEKLSCEALVIIGRGRYNPITKMHLRHFAIARKYLEETKDCKVVGGLLVLKHGTEVRQRCRQKPTMIIPPRHRLGLVRAAVGASPWLTVDPWEITRRRISDYLTTLDHVGALFEHTCSKVKLILLVAPVELLRLNPQELRDAGHECLTICRPQEHQRLISQLGSRWSQLVHVIEDRALLSAELEASSCSKARTQLASSFASPLLPSATYYYLQKHQIAQKMAGLSKWTPWDKELLGLAGNNDKDNKDRGYRRQPQKIGVPYESTSFIVTK